jgi:glyoxylase-like metal-dependent hydrolase (beta-lactamase superfamily II)
MPSEYRVGAITVTRVTEQCGPGFLPGVLYPDWDPAVLQEAGAAMLPDGLDPASGKLISSIHTWVVRTPHHTILIDTCAGNHKHRPALPRLHQLDLPFLDRLAKAGVRPEAVDFVLCTHLHADHCGWNTRLIDGRWVPTFPNAKYVFSRAEYDRWSAPDGGESHNAGVFEDSVLPVIATNQAQVIDGAGVIADGLAFHPTPGHSPGHVAVTLEDKDHLGLFSGDIMHQPVQVVRPEWNSRFCEDPLAARTSRRWLLEQAAEHDATVFTAHFAQSSAGFVTRCGDRFSWRFSN